MGIQNIIKNSEEETPASENIHENDPFFDDEDLLIVIGVDSNTSDTESFSGLDDANELLESGGCSSSWNSESDSDFENEVVEIPNLFNGQENGFKLEEKSPHNQSSFGNENKSESNHHNLVHRMKNISVKSRQCMGKKKARRLENARQLELLVGDENIRDCDINDFMPSEFSFRFSQILEDGDLANKILNPVANNDSNLCGFMAKDDQPRKKKRQSSRTMKLSGHAAFNNLDASEKTFFRRRNLPLGMVQYLDACVVSFFESNPTGTYISEPLSSFERLILHCIAHYYELNSLSFDINNRKGRSTKITNSFKYFNPPCLFLSQYIEEHVCKYTCSGPANRQRFRK